MTALDTLEAEQVRNAHGFYGSQARRLQTAAQHPLLRPILEGTTAIGFIWTRCPAFTFAKSFVTPIPIATIPLTRTANFGPCSTMALVNALATQGRAA